MVRRVAEALLERGGSWQRWYDAGSVDELSRRMLGEASGSLPCP
jgi:hypothetical protein